VGERGDTPGEGQSAAEDSDGRIIARQIDNLGSQLHKQNEKSRGQEKWRAYREWFTIVALIATAGVGLCSLREAIKATKAATRQETFAYETLDASLRPWLYFSGDHVPMIEPHSGNAFDVLSADISNEGNGLARDVHIGGKIIVLEETGYYQQSFANANIPCVTSVPVIFPQSRIRAIPPHGHAKGILFGVASGDPLKRAGVHGQLEQYLVGCISYKWLATEKKEFHTYFMIPATVFNRKPGETLGNGQMWADSEDLDFKFKEDASVIYVDLD
jgi:hypothetical protein